MRTMFNAQIDYLADADGNFPSNLIIEQNNIMGISILFNHISEGNLPLDKQSMYYGLVNQH